MATRPTKVKPDTKIGWSCDDLFRLGNTQGGDKITSLGEAGKILDQLDYARRWRAP